MRDTKYDVNDTIVAVSSPTSDKRVIIRLTGPETIETCRQIFDLPESSCVNGQGNTLIKTGLKIDDGLEVETQIYLFFAPHSYTGDDVAEIHIHTNSAVTEFQIGNFLDKGLRMAGPGEFTVRAYLNGKIDLAQAEAVNEIIVSSNAFQLAAAEKLLSGRLSDSIAKVRSAMMDCLSLLEAGLDFSSEDIEFTNGTEVIERLIDIEERLEQLLSGSIRDESLMDLSAVGIAGAPNAGKSSLLNKLLGKERSIVSYKRKTTRDVLTALLKLVHCECVLFDCAGLLLQPDNILDELAQQAAIEALGNSSMVLFCVDVSKTQWLEDISIRELIEPKILIPVATKCDLVSKEVLSNCLAELNELFGVELLVTSAQTGAGLDMLREIIDKRIVDSGCSKLDTRKVRYEQRASGIEHQATSVALLARHKQAVSEAIESIRESTEELKVGNEEVAAMILRVAYQTISGIGSSAGKPEQVDEQILGQIFSRFCIGK